MDVTGDVPSARRGLRGYQRLLSTSRPFQLLIASLVAAVVAPIVGAHYYTGEIMWPLVIGGYSGAALAFTTALFWDRHSRLQDEVRQAEAERRRTAERLRQEQEQRVVEAKRRFGALVDRKSVV